MKIRNGFVSNSSSSSYVVFIPDDFDIDYTLYENDDNVDINILKTKIQDLKNGHGINQYDSGNEYDILCEELSNRNLIVLSIISGPDEGTIDVITKEKITEIYNKYIGVTK